MTEADIEELKKLLLEVWESPEDNNYYEKIVARIQELSPDPSWTDYIDDYEYVMPDDSLDIVKVLAKINSYQSKVFYGDKNGEISE